MFLVNACIRHVIILRRSEMWRMCGEGQGKWTLPVLAVLPVVVVSTLTGVTMFAERLVHAAGCVFTRVQQARIHAVTPKVTWHTAPMQTFNTFHTWVHTHTRTHVRAHIQSNTCVVLMHPYTQIHIYSFCYVIWYLNRILWVALICFLFSQMNPSFSNS